MANGGHRNAAWMSSGRPIDFNKLILGEFEGIRRVRNPILVVSVPSFGSLGRDRTVVTLQYERNADGDPSVRRNKPIFI